MKCKHCGASGHSETGCSYMKKELKKIKESWKLKKVTSIGIYCKTCGRPIVKEDIKKYLSSQRQEIIKYLEKKYKRAKHMFTDNPKYEYEAGKINGWNQAIDDIILKLTETSKLKNKKK